MTCLLLFYENKIDYRAFKDQSPITIFTNTYLMQKLLLNVLKGLKVLNIPFLSFFAITQCSYISNMRISRATSFQWIVKFVNYNDYVHHCNTLFYQYANFLINSQKIIMHEFTFTVKCLRKPRTYMYATRITISFNFNMKGLIYLFLYMKMRK